MLAEFCDELLTKGEALVLAQMWKVDEAQQNDAIFRMEDLESIYRLELPGNPPCLSRPGLIWAARTVAWAATMLVDREEGETTIPSEIEEGRVANCEPSTIYSVDFLMRFLPSLVNNARRVDSDDPLLDTLLRLAEEWPLSSVGLEHRDGLRLCDQALKTIENDPSLSALYVDRIIATKDRTRIDLPWVQRRIRETAGSYSHLVEKTLVDE